MKLDNRCPALFRDEDGIVLCFHKGDVCPYKDNRECETSRIYEIRDAQRRQAYALNIGRREQR